MSSPGFWIKENILTEEECNALIEALSVNPPTRGRAGARHLMTHPAVAAVASDPRMVQIARCALGQDAVPFRATLFEKSGRANWLVTWHQDTALPLTSYINSAEWGPWSRKAGVLYAHAPAWALCRVLALRLHLDPSTIENGSLRVIPGSHVAGVLSDAEVFDIARSQESETCLVSRGGVLAMRPLVIHSSSKVQCDKPRRVLHIEYADTLELDGEIHLVVA
jgi:ectoine hydroxylase-related dioxygenase (phytanoyl-CoA dioxygenase family)